MSGVCCLYIMLAGGVPVWLVCIVLSLLLFSHLGVLLILPTICLLCSCLCYCMLLTAVAVTIYHADGAVGIHTGGWYCLTVVGIVVGFVSVLSLSHGCGRYFRIHFHHYY